MMKNKRVLVIAAHPDDEVLGCGGSIKKWKNNRMFEDSSYFSLILAEGLTSRVKNRNEVPTTEIETLRKNALEFASIIGYDEMFFEDFPDNRMDGVDLLDVIHKVSEYIKRLSPQIILTHHHGDLNVDHRITYQAVITACRPLAGSCVEAIYSFQIPSSTEWNFPYHKNLFSPNFFVDISTGIEAKLAAMVCYESEKRLPPHPRSEEILKATAMQWGSVVGLHYAEAFEIIYSIQK